MGVRSVGDMPAAIDAFSPPPSSPPRVMPVVAAGARYQQRLPGFQDSQTERQRFAAQFTSRGGYLTADGAIRGELLYPPREDAPWPPRSAGKWW